MRTKNQTFGFVQKTLLNQLAYVDYKGNFTDSIAKFFKTDDSINIPKKELTILIYEFYLSEKTERLKETGRLKISMRFFVNNNENNFKEALFIDSIYEFNSLDVTKKLFESANIHLHEIRNQIIDLGIKNSFEKKPNSYSYNDLLKLDSIEKINIPIYGDVKIKSGIFYSYAQFQKNTPDSASLIIDMKDLKNIKILEYDYEKEENVEISTKNIYAIAIKDTLLKATSVGFYRLYKENNEYYYVGKTSYTPVRDKAEISAGYILFGLVGAVIAQSTQKNRNFFVLKIGYLKGNSIPLSPIDDY
jgi:hypothetical protein